MGAEDIIIKLLDPIYRWALLQAKRKHKANKAKERKKKKAIDAVLEAIIVSSAYRYDRKNDSPRNRHTEQKISSLWRKAARRVYDVDRRFSTLLSLKAQVWADPELWNDTRYRGAHIKMATIREQLEWLQKQE